MEQRRLGSTDLMVSALGFGCAPVASRAGTGASRRAMERAFERGVTFFDTADMYGLGGSETLVGRVFASRRERVVLSSKCGYAFSSRMAALSWLKPLVRPLVKRLKGAKSAAGAVLAAQRSQCFEPNYVEKCAHDSLRRLRTDRIDVYFLHDPPLEVVTRGDAFGALERLQQQGKIRHYGVSCDVPVAVAALNNRDTGVSAVQVEASLLEREALGRLLALARERNVGFIARQPFANGKLFHDTRVSQALRAAGLGADPQSIAALALRFVRDTPGVATVLPSMIQAQHVDGNTAAMERGPLSPAERAAADSLGAPHAG